MSARYHVRAVRPGSAYTLWLRFADGLAGTVSLKSLLAIDGFRLLRDASAFNAVYVDPETGAVVWPAGVRLNPEILYQYISAHGGECPVPPGDDPQFRCFLAAASGELQGLPRPQVPAQRKTCTDTRRREDALIARALEILEARLAGAGERYTVDGPGAAKAYVRMKLGEIDHEVFLVIFLDAGNHSIAVEELFKGTLDQVDVHTREIARAALRLNAAGVILVHNHPFGTARFSEADGLLTREAQRALRLLGIKVVDHLLVAGREVASWTMIERAREAEAERDCAERLRAKSWRQSQAAKAAWARRRGAGEK